jgi:hypothetical protein
MFLRSLLAETRLKVNEETQRTFVKSNESEIFTVPICVTKATYPLGNFTSEETTAVMVVKNLIELTIWSVAPVSIIQECL